MKSVTEVFAPAKINLYLKVTGRRADGYHLLDTLMAKLDLGDQLRLERIASGVTLQCPDSNLPEGPENLAYRAAQQFLVMAAVDGGVAITLRKRTPIAAGLGGGSSDAAAVLRGMNELYGSPLSTDELLQAAVRLGADVPFFVADMAMARATGIGEELEPVKMEGGFWVLLVNPGFAVSTKKVFATFALTSRGNPYILGREWHIKKQDRLFQRHQLPLLENDLEAVTCRQYPELQSIKQQLITTDAVAALMSGSGPTVFALYDQVDAARSAGAQLVAQYGKGVLLCRLGEP